MATTKSDTPADVLHLEVSAQVQWPALESVDIESSGWAYLVGREFRDEELLLLVRAEAPQSSNLSGYPDG